MNAISAPAPEGFTREWDDSIWNAGHVFRWSPVFGGFVRDVNFRAGITVKPGECLQDAYKRAYGEHYDPTTTEIFFVEWR